MTPYDEKKQRDEFEHRYCPSGTRKAVRDALWESLQELARDHDPHDREVTYNCLCEPLRMQRPSEGAISWEKWWRDPARFSTGEADDETTAPYMVTVQASRVSHSPPGAALFDSEVRHQHYIVLRVNSASRKRDLSRDWIHTDKELIEVAMTESQWSAMISTLNHGSGTPATLNHIFHQEPPVRPTLEEDRTSLFSGELAKTHANILARLEALEAGRLTKAQKQEIGVIKSHLKSNSTFVEKQFNEHMEHRTARMKGDVEAYVNATIGRAGARALGLPDHEHRDDGHAYLEDDLAPPDTTKDEWLEGWDETAERSSEMDKDHTNDEDTY